MSVYEGLCYMCKHRWQGLSVNASECECKNITEDEIDKYFVNGDKGCPHYEEEKYLISLLLTYADIDMLYRMAKDYETKANANCYKDRDRVAYIREKIEEVLYGI
mgnify:CR=1 FL=1